MPGRVRPERIPVAVGHPRPRRLALLRRVDAVEDYVSRSPLTEQEVEAWRETVVRSRDWLRARGAAYVFTIAPDKHVIYPEHMPASMHQVGPSRRMDQVLEAVAASGVAVDVRPAIEAAKSGERVYHLTDSHWNARGALVAYQSIVAALRAQHPAVPAAWKRSDFEEVERETGGLDLARMMGLNRMLRERTSRSCRSGAAWRRSSIRRAPTFPPSWAAS